MEFTNVSKKNLFTWFRRLDGDEWYVECNLSEDEIRRPKRPEGFRGILTNVSERKAGMMQPYEACLYRRVNLDFEPMDPDAEEEE